MPQITSPLSTPTGMPALNSAHLGKAAGLRIHFALFSDFTAAITTGTSSYAADLWADGQEMTIASEADSGAVRVWRTALGHARTVKVGRLEVVLPANSNVVLAAAGVPVSGTGANGDLSVDKAAGIAYLKTAGAWGAAGSTNVNVVDSLTSTSVTDALSAAKGKALKDTADALAVTVAGKQAALVVSSKSSTTVLGDSLLAYGMVQQAGSGNSGSFSNSHIGWMNDILRLNGGVGFDVLYMRAVAGTDVATILSVQVPLAVADPTEVAICNAGINSMQTTGPSISTVLASYASLVSQLAAAKKLVIMIGMNPVSQSTAGTQKSRIAEVPMVNNAFRKICSAYSNVIFVDSFDTLLDPTSNNLEPVANNVHTDGIHKSSIGARIEGYDQLDKLRSRINLTKYKTLGANLLPAWSGTGGTRASNAASAGAIAGAGNPPASFDVSRIQGGNSTSQVDVSTLGPDHIRFVLQGKSAGGVIWSISLSAAAQAALAAQFQAGDVVQAGMGFQLTGNNFCRGVYCLIVVDGTANWNAMGASGNESPVNYPQVAHGGYRMTEPFTFASNPTTVDFRIYINNGLSSLAASTLDVYDTFLAKLT